MCRRSTMPVSSCSAPIGRWIATQCSESCSCSEPSTRKKSARSRSSMFTNMTRERLPSAARFQLREVCTSTPITPLTTNSAPSTTRIAAIASPTKPASPGVSMRLILRPCHSAWQTLAASDMFRRCSSSSQSETVEPASMVPSRFVAPAWNSIASTSDVFPVPRCPTTATLRIFPGSWAMHPPRLWCSVWPIDDLSDSPARADAVRGRAEIAILKRTRRPPPPASEHARQKLGSRRGRGPGKPALEPQDRLRVELRHTRLGDAEDLADLAQRQVLVVVEREHELLALGQIRDRVGDGLAQLGR